MTNFVATVVRVGAVIVPPILSSNKRAAKRPTSIVGTLMVVKGGSAYAAQEILSKPTTAMLLGTSRPR